MEIPTAHATQPEIGDREEEVQEVSVDIDFPESDIPEIDLQPEESSDVEVNKRELGSFRYRDRFWYRPTESTARRSSSYLDSDSDDEQVDIVTPAPG